MKKIAFVSNNAMYFYTHRLQLGLYAQSKGYEVILLVGKSSEHPTEMWAEREIKKAGITVWNFNYTAAGTNPFTELVGLLKLIIGLHKLRPNIVHSMSPKGNLYGGIASMGLPTSNVFSISGVGYLFLKAKNESISKKILRKLYSFFFRKVLQVRKSKAIIIQNNHDLAKMVPNSETFGMDVHLIPGMGIPIKKVREITQKENLVLFPARMLKNKGAYEFAEIAMALKKKYPSWRFVMAGLIDFNNPDTVLAHEIRIWSESGVEILNFVKDMSHLYNSAAIVCLPSHGEGFPKCLVEASEASAAIVTNNVVGCRDVISIAIKDDEEKSNLAGILVEKQDIDQLKAAVERLIIDEEFRQKVAAVARRNAVNHFNIEDILVRFGKIYDSF